MKGTDHFKRTIQMYLEQRAAEDELFANGKQIFSFFYICLIFFDNMSYEPEIMLNQDMLGI